MSYNMTDQQKEICRENKNLQNIQSNKDQQQQEYMKSVCDNFLYFIEQINKQSRQEYQTQKKKIQKKNKNIKKKTITKQQKKNRSKYESQQNTQSYNQKQSIYKDDNFQKEFDNLIQQGMSVNDIHHLINLLQNKQYDKILQELKAKYPSLLNSFSKQLQTGQIQQNSRQCFTTYLQQHGLPQGQMPNNCLHINICYYIWERQGKTHIDPTLSGRERKSQQMQNKLLEQQKNQSKQFSQIQINVINFFFKFLNSKMHIMQIQKLKIYNFNFFFANQFLMDEFVKLEQLQEFEKFSLNKDEQQNKCNSISNEQLNFYNSNDIMNTKRYRFNSFENQNQLNEKDMNLLQCLMQNDFIQKQEDNILKKRRKFSQYDNDNNLELSQKSKISFPISEDREIQQISNDQLLNNQKEIKKIFKDQRKIITQQQEQSIKQNIQQISTEKAKLNAKIIKVAAFWKNKTFFIPNVFRMIKPIVQSKEFIFEIQDLSMKEVLIQNNGQKIKEMQ